MRRRIPAMVAALLALAVGQASAQSNAVEAELRRCRAIPDSLARVACYDGIALPAPAPSAPGTAQAPSGSSGVASAAGTRAAVPAAPPAATAAPSAAVAASPQGRDFGLPERPVSSLPQSIESAIEGEFDGWTAGARLRLANGQVWEIVDGSTASYQLRDPKVRISRGMFGSFFISIEGVAQTPRVRRVR